MKLLVLAIGGSVLSVVSAVLVAKGATRSRIGGDEYNRKKRLKTIGVVGLIVGPVIVSVAVFAHFYAKRPSLDYVAVRERMDEYEPPPAPSVDSVRSTLVKDEEKEHAAPVHSNSFVPAPSSSSEAPVPNRYTPAVPTVPVTSVNRPSPTEEQKLEHSPLEQLNTIIQADPKNAAALAARGNIYASKTQWDQAEQDYRSSLQIDGQNPQTNFNLAETSFQRKKFDAARPGFLLVTKDPYLGDLAVYKVYLCDLLGGHPDVAAQELDAFNKVGGNPSYYFANMASCLVQGDKDGAKSWSKSAKYIYPPARYNLYAQSLVGLSQPAAAPVVSAPSPQPAN